jgi:hypothetical protein
MPPAQESTARDLGGWWGVDHSAASPVRLHSPVRQAAFRRAPLHEKERPRGGQLGARLVTQAGPIDVLMVTPSGLPILVECKLWRNPKARREVGGQILDYAKELSRWSLSDLQREVSRRLGQQGNSLLEMVRRVDPAIDETAFNDALTANLRRGRHHGRTQPRQLFGKRRTRSRAVQRRWIERTQKDPRGAFWRLSP